MELTFEKFDIIVAPDEHIVLSDPLPDFRFDHFVGIEFDYRIICAVKAETTRFELFEHYETPIEDDFAALITVSDETRVSNLFVFLKDKERDRLQWALGAVAGSPFVIQLQGIVPDLGFEAKGRRVFGVKHMPLISVSRRPEP